MLRFFLVAWIASVAAGCGSDCAQSADIQVTVVPNGDVASSRISRLHVMLGVEDGPVRSLDIVPQNPLTSSGSAFILRPDPAPPSAKYLVTLTVQAFDAQSTLLAIGSDSQQVVSKGCNRLSLRLAGLPPAPPDMAIVSTDMAGVLPADLAGCSGGTPDEDADGRSNSCDACPADSDPSPVDSDGDGLPDACDPDPATAGSANKLLYFEPFDVVNPKWSGDTATTISQSYINLDPMAPGILLSNNATDTLPLNVRVQTNIFPKGYYTGGGMIDTGLFVGTNPDPNAANGVLCRLNSSSNSLDIVPVQNGVQLSGSSAGLMINAGFYRVRLTQRGNKWTCDATFNNATTTVMTTQTVTAPLYMSLRAENMFVHFHSVVAETALP